MVLMDWEDRLDDWELELELGAALDGSDWVTLEKAAAETGVSRAALRTWYRGGQIPSRLVDGPHGPQRLVPLAMVAERAGAACLAKDLSPKFEFCTPLLKRTSEPQKPRQDRAQIVGTPRPIAQLVKYGQRDAEVGECLPRRYRLRRRMPEHRSGLNADKFHDGALLLGERHPGQFGCQSSVGGGGVSGDSRIGQRLAGLRHGG